MHVVIGPGEEVPERIINEGLTYYFVRARFAPWNKHYLQAIYESAETDNASIRRSPGRSSNNKPTPPRGY